MTDDEPRQMPEEEQRKTVEAALRTLIGTSGRYPTKDAITAVPGLQRLIDQTGGDADWARRLGVRWRSARFTHDEVEAALRELVAKHGCFPPRGEIPSGLRGAIARLGGYEYWAEHLEVPLPAYAMSRAEVDRLRAAAQHPAEPYDEALAWRPPDPLPDGEAELVSLIAEIDAIVDQLRTYGRATALRITDLRGPVTPPKGVVDASQGHVIRRQEHQAREDEQRLDALVRLNKKARAIAKQLRDLHARRDEVLGRLETLRRPGDEPAGDRR